MSLFETEGLILKTYSLSEADKIVLFFTEKYGVVRGVAKGAKRLKSRFAGSLEPFSIVQLAFFQKEERELVSIRQIELLKSFFSVTSEPQTLQKFAYLAELLGEFAPPHDPNENLYRMTRVCFENASNSPGNLDVIALYFEFWLLRLGGYLPGWENCSICKRNFSPTEPAFLQADFHLFCGNCRQGTGHNKIDAEERNIYKLARRHPPEEFIKMLENRVEAVSNLSNVLKKIIMRILNREVTSEKFLLALP